MKQNFKRIYLEKLVQPELLGNISFLPHDSLLDKRVERLRKFTKIDKLISKKKSDLERALEIARYTSLAWKHDGFNSTPKKQDAYTLLKLAEKGASFSCVQFASVFVQLCQSVGIPARVLNVTTKQPSLGSSGHGHVTAEYFDNDYQKWIWLDPQIHSYAIYKTVPLSQNELAELVTEGKKPLIKFSDRTLEYMNGDKKGFKLLQNFINRYVWSSTIGGLKSFYSSQKNIVNVGCKRKQVLPAITFQGFADKMPLFIPQNAFDAPINSCNIQFETFAPKKKYEWKGLADYKENAYLNFATNEVEISLTNNMPWFSHYIIRINGKKRIVKIHRIKLKLLSGKNIIEVQGVNLWKRIGPKSVAEVHFDNKYQNVKSYW